MVAAEVASRVELLLEAAGDKGLPAASKNANESSGSVQALHAPPSCWAQLGMLPARRAVCCQGAC